LLTACASNPVVAPLGGDRYFVSHQAATGFSGIGTLQAEVLREADAFCDSKQKRLEVVSTKESKPPYVLGNFPRSVAVLSHPMHARNADEHQIDQIVQQQKQGLPASTSTPTARSRFPP